MVITGTYSGFLVNIDDDLVIGPTGQVIGTRGPLKKWYSDASVAFGLFDRAEVGAAVHSLDDNGSGNLFGLFGQLALVRPSPSGQGIGLSAGAKYANSPEGAGLKAYIDANGANSDTQAIVAKNIEAQLLELKKQGKIDATDAAIHDGAIEFAKGAVAGSVTGY